MRVVKKIVITLAGLILCAACSSTQKTQEPAIKPVIKSVLIVPMLDPVVAVTGRKMGAHTLLYAIAPVGGAAARQIEMNRNAEDTAAVMKAMASSKLLLATEMTQLLTADLKQQGYAIDTMPKEFMGPPDDPLEIRYEKLKGRADALLIVDFEQATLHAYTTSAGYEPKLNVAVKLVDLNTEDYLFEANYYYGLDAKRGRKDQFPSEQECIFANLDQVTGNGKGLANCFRTGLQLIAKNASTGLLASVR